MQHANRVIWRFSSTSFSGLDTLTVALIRLFTHLRHVISVKRFWHCYLRKWCRTNGNSRKVLVNRRQILIHQIRR